MKLARVVLESALLLGCVSLAAAPASKEPSAIDPAKAGWNTAALDDLAAYVQSHKTTGFLIIQDRKVIYEHNWPLAADAATFQANFTHGTDAHGALEEDIASGQKSFVAILAGVAIDKRLLDISKPVSDYLGAGWSKAAPEEEKIITVRNLLEMRLRPHGEADLRSAGGNEVFLQHSGLRDHEAGAGEGLRPEARRHYAPLAHRAGRR